MLSILRKKQKISKFRRTKKAEPHDPLAYSGNRHVACVRGCTSPAKMVEAASEASIDLASLLRANKVEALHTTALCGLVRFLVWTRLSEEGSSWIIK